MSKSAENQTVLVTGGAGFIGSHTCKLLKKQGYNPVVFDNLRTGHREFVKWGQFFQGDLCDQQQITDVLRQVRPAAVLHFAALAYVGESVTNPELYYRNNVVGSLNLLEAMRAVDCRKIVFSSTCATYGEPSSATLNEQHAQNPVNPYGQTKLIVERMLKDFYSAHKIASVSLRYFNAAGADPEGEVGEAHEPEPHLVPLVLAAAAHQNSSISVFGVDYPTPDKTCVRDYIHVSDLASAHVKAIEYMAKNDAGAAAFNLGTGRGWSVLEVIQKVEKVTGKKVKVDEQGRRSGDVPVLVADAARALKELGWKPEYPDLETQIQHAWNWLRRQK